MNLRGTREAKQMTQSQVAEKVGIARESYTNIENGVRRPSVEVAQKIGKVLEFPWPMIFEPSNDDSEGATNNE